MFGRFGKSIRENQAKALEAQTYAKTLRYLREKGEINEQEEEILSQKLRIQLNDSRYILSNLGAHLGIGAIFAFDLIPLPLGTIGRVSWVIGARIVETVRRNFDRARIHSAGVLLIAAIPWFGYAAYLLPLRRQAKELAFVLANHIMIVRKNKSYAEFLQERSRPIRKFGNWFIPRPGLITPK